VKVFAVYFPLLVFEILFKFYDRLLVF